MSLDLSSLVPGARSWKRASASIRRRPTRVHGLGAFLVAQALIVLVIAAGVLTGGGNTRVLYVYLLFTLCSTALIGLDGWNGRHALPAAFLGVYFVYFGAEPLAALFTVRRATTPEALGATAGVVLAGAALAIGGYRLALRAFARAPDARRPKDWRLGSIVSVGLLLWLLGTYATYVWYFHVVTDTTIEATRTGLARLGELRITALILAQMGQPLGALLLIYAWRVRRGWLLAGLIVLLLVLQVVLGFVIDIKGTALLAGALVIASILLIDGRIPFGWLAGAAIFVHLSFPVFQAYREFVHGDLGLARTTVLQNLGQVFDLALANERRTMQGPDRAQSFFERLSLLGSVHMVVSRTGDDVPYEHGYTLLPLISAFVPRLIWPDKPDVQAGQVVNQAFHVSPVASTYISPSHLGELYWNFGWPGVLIGMPLIGALFGFVGARFNLREGRSVTRLLVTVVTLHYVVQGFEGTIAVSYVVWMRSLAAIGLLHLLFARTPSARRVKPSGNAVGAVETVARPVAVRPFPNLLR